MPIFLNIFIGNFSLKETQTPPPRKRPKILFHQSIENLLKRKQNFVSAKFTVQFLFYSYLKFYSKELASGLREIFRKNRHFCLGHVIHQNSPEFSQDSEYAIQKILRPIVLELQWKNGNQVRLGQIRLGLGQDQIRVRLGQLGQVRLGQVRVSQEVRLGVSFWVILGQV